MSAMDNTIREEGARAGSDSFTNRLLTYDHRWSGRKDKEELACAGFSYTGIGDKVECVHCGLKLLNWTSTDDPLHEHATRRPLCPFINSRYRQLGQTKLPKHPKYQQLQDRLDSFTSWPTQFVPTTPEELAAAGFFYIGSADRVTCFQCGITLRDWEEEHDPVVEHQRYSENCQFINKMDVNDLGVATRTINNNDTNQSGHEQTQEEVEAAGANGREATAVSGHTFEKFNMVRSQTSEDEALPSVSPSIVSTNQSGHKTDLDQLRITSRTTTDNRETRQTTRGKECVPSNTVTSSEETFVDDNCLGKIHAFHTEEEARVSRHILKKGTCKKCRRKTQSEQSSLSICINDLDVSDCVVCQHNESN